MSNTLTYKNYIGTVNFSEEDNVFFGKVIGITDSISFEGDSVENLIEDFHNAIDEYLKFCKKTAKNRSNNIREALMCESVPNSTGRQALWHRHSIFH